MRFIWLIALSCLVAFAGCAEKKNPYEKLIGYVAKLEASLETGVNQSQRNELIANVVAEVKLVENTFTPTQKADWGMMDAKFVLIRGYQSVGATLDQKDINELHGYCAALRKSLSEKN